MKKSIVTLVISIMALFLCSSTIINADKVTSSVSIEIKKEKSHDLPEKARSPSDTKLPKTNETNTILFSIIGVFIVGNLIKNFRKKEKKMKKVILSSVLASAVILSSVGGVVVNAAEITDDSAVTEAAVSVTSVSDEDTPEIIDPEGNDNGETTGHGGQFTIDAVPNFDFGETTVAGATIKLDSATKSAVQVSDRRSSGSGWTLNVKLGEFNNTDPSKTGKEAKLAGVSMNLGIIGDLVANEGNNNMAPAKKAIKLEAGGGSDNLLTADTDTEDVVGMGRGSWLGRFSDGMTETETSLFIPGGNYEGSYAADLTWTLSQTV
ncbi:WxL domain-containing protein [Vagococcus xieshaowenii]|uniref:WxL domain-containing protein n=1 Tax=Vagococcus xieshaowenii TaxID=2562451 RepID=A0AAJ5EDM3_9ENTE|nr:WxL domain-containing protein [Vagococcus xieshaowenii]QCA27929.1 WxL domain-containing protein [Vagococcus xieshaowenii]TFZ40314.1 WxL domain-containing protein [Vagococcus xieshaowenii]